MTRTSLLRCYSNGNEIFIVSSFSKCDDFSNNLWKFERKFKKKKLRLKNELIFNDDCADELFYNYDKSSMIGISLEKVSQNLVEF